MHIHIQNHIQSEKDRDANIYTYNIQTDMQIHRDKYKHTYIHSYIHSYREIHADIHRDIQTNTSKQIDRERNRHIYIQQKTTRQADRQTDTGMHTGRQTVTYTNRQPTIYTYNHRLRDKDIQSCKYIYIQSDTQTNRDAYKTYRRREHT